MVEANRTRALGTLTLAVVGGLAVGFSAATWLRPAGPAIAPDWALVFEQVAPGVLLVEVEAPTSRLGAGFAVGPGEVVTARHLVIDTDAVRVRGVDGRITNAVVVGTDARTDLALLRVDADLTPAVLADTAALRVGDPVVAVGNPFGLGHSLSTGVVAHRGRRLSATADGPRVDFLQLSIPLNPGNSGGPVFDREGRVIGVLSGTHTQGQAIAFAVPVEVVRAGLPALRAGAHVSRAFLGLRTVVQDGVVSVESVVASGPADRAGVRPGDVLTSVAGTSVDTSEALVELLDRLPGGQSISVRLLRDGQMRIIDVVLGDWALQPVVVSGMTLRAQAGSGGQVVAVRPRSRSERAGVQVGDRVLRVDGLPVQAPVAVREALGGGGGTSTIELERAGAALTLRLD